MKEAFLENSPSQLRVLFGPPCETSYPDLPLVPQFTTLRRSLGTHLSTQFCRLGPHLPKPPIRLKNPIRTKFLGKISVIRLPLSTYKQNSPDKKTTLHTALTRLSSRNMSASTTSPAW